MKVSAWWQKGLRTVSAGVLLMSCWTTTSEARDLDTWQFEATIYGWYSGIDGEIAYPDGPGSGRDIAVDASDILDNLNMIFMGGIQAHRNRWSLVADVIYLDVSDDAGRTLTIGPSPGIPVDASVGVDLSTWILGGGIGYDVIQTDRTTLAVLGGVRYLTTDIDVSLALRSPVTTAAPAAAQSDSLDVVDGIIGLRGFISLNQQWYLPYHFDIGAGDSELTWQAFAGIGYRFGWGDVRLGYRYLSYEFEDDMLLQELDMGGPLLGFGFRF